MNGLHIMDRTDSLDNCHFPQRYVAGLRLCFNFDKQQSAFFRSDPEVIVKRSVLEFSIAAEYSCSDGNVVIREEIDRGDAGDFLPRP